MQRRRKKKSVDATGVIPRGKPENDKLLPPIAWGNVIEDTLRVGDMATLAKRLQADLTLGDGRTDYGHVLEAVDKAARNFIDAVKLARLAQIEDERFNLECEEELEVLRSNARQELQQKKQKGSGAITKQQVEDCILSNWPTRYRTIKDRQSKMHATRRVFERLVDAWNHRNQQLSRMLERASIGRPVSGGMT